MDKELYRRSMMAEIAYLYYKKGLTQEEIGQRMFLSRTRISRLLQQAYDSGIVEVKVHSQLMRNYVLEESIRQRFPIKQALIYNSRDKDEKEIVQGVASVAAEYIKTMLRKNLTIGVSWGRSVSETVDALEVDDPISANIVQIMGFAAMDDFSKNSNDIAGRLAHKLHGRVYYLNTPLFVEDDHTRERIISDPVVFKTIMLAKSADLVITGIGAMDNTLTANPWAGYMNNEMLQEIIGQGGVGCIGSIFFDGEGEILCNRWNNHCIGIPLEDLKRMDAVLAVAWGTAKCRAIIGAMRGGLIDVIASDAETMEEIIRIYDNR